MWLKPPGGKGAADDITDPGTIASLKHEGWQEVPGVWMRRGDDPRLTFYVTHPEHIKRLLSEGAAIVDDPLTPPAPQEPIVATFNGKSYTQADLDALKAFLGSEATGNGPHDDGEPDHEGAPDDQRPQRGKSAIRR